jgi:hypothetical protein
LGILNPLTNLGYNNKYGYRYRTKDYNRNNNLLKLYKLTLDDWNALFKAQGNVCAICGTDEMRGHNWHTDHAHGSNIIRGILCGWCNTGIGKLQESAEIMRKAISYIKKHKKKELH